MSFSRETTHAAKKPHQCNGCLGHINVGERYVRWSGLTDGDFGSAAYHEDCRKAEIALNKQIGACYDEWYRLEEIVADEGKESLAAYPTVAARFA